MIYVMIYIIYIMNLYIEKLIIKNLYIYIYIYIHTQTNILLNNFTKFFFNLYNTIYIY
jgi:hypothetical protein